MTQVVRIVEALGGADNIIAIEPCITRLRCEVDDPTLVKEPELKAAGAHGVHASGNVVHVIVGPQADVLASELEDLWHEGDNGHSAD